MTKHLGTERPGVLTAALSRRAVLQAGAATALAASGLGHVGNAFANPALAPFSYHAPLGALDDLRQRLAHTRWPEREPVADWSLPKGYPPRSRGPSTGINAF